MTKEYELRMGGDGVYYYHGRKAICYSFIQELIGITPDAVQVNVSNHEFEDSQCVSVSKIGFYRWYVQGIGVCRPMYPVAEDEVAGFYPDKPESGVESEPLWIQIQVCDL